MYKTLRLSFSLKNTYRVNSILFAIKQIPLVKKILPDVLYGVRGAEDFCKYYFCDMGDHLGLPGQIFILYYNDLRDRDSV